MADAPSKTLLELAKDLRVYAELTARNSKNWDNFEEIALQMLTAIAKQS